MLLRRRLAFLHSRDFAAGLDFAKIGSNTRKRLNSYNFTANDLDYTKGSKPQKAIYPSRKAFCPATTNPLAPSHLDNRKYHRAASCEPKNQAKKPPPPPPPNIRNSSHLSACPWPFFQASATSPT